MISAAELQRYSRQIALPEFGLEGQNKLARARVLVVGAGGLGSPAAMYLAAAGVGTLGIVDFDVVDASNLHRQLLHGTGDVGRAKVESAVERLREVNPHTIVEPHRISLNSTNAMGIVSSYDLVIDASDNFPTRYLVNDACVLSGILCVYGSVERFDGQLSVFAGKDGPCYRCLFREPPPPGLIPTCAEAGVLGVMPGLVGMMQATEAIKLIVGMGEPLIGKLLLIDVRRMRFRTIDVQRDPECPVCGTREQRTLIDYEAFCGVRPANEDTPLEIDARTLAQRLAAGAPPVLVDVREAWENAYARIPGSRLLPSSTFPDSMREVPRDQDVVVYCHTGMRSARWLQALRADGFTRVSHLRGGIDAWSREVDPTVPRY